MKVYGMARPQLQNSEKSQLSFSFKCLLKMAVNVYMFVL